MQQNYELNKPQGEKIKIINTSNKYIINILINTVNKIK